MTQPFPEIIVRSYDDLADACQAIKNYLGLSNEVLEEIAGLARGHVDKLLGPSREKNIGPRTLPLILGALGCRLRLEPDPEQAQRVASRWDRRNESQVRTTPARISEILLARAARELGRRGAIAAAKARRQARRRKGRA